MKWEDLQTSENIEDRRGEEGGGMFGGPSMGGGGIGLGTMVILGIIGYALGINPALLIGGAEMLGKMRGGGQVVRQDRPGDTSQPTDQMGQFVAKILGSNEEVWSAVLPAQEGIQLKAPRLVLFDGVTDSRCGTAQSAMGPFYCPIDQRIYLD